MNIETEICITIEEAKEIIHQHIVKKAGIDVDRISSFGFWSAGQEEKLGEGNAILFMMKIDGSLPRQRQNE